MVCLFRFKTPHFPALSFPQVAPLVFQLSPTQRQESRSCHPLQPCICGETLLGTKCNYTNNIHCIKHRTWALRGEEEMEGGGGGYMRLHMCVTSA